MIKIISENGCGRSARIVDAETGADLTATLAIEYGGKITLGETIKAELSLLLVRADIGIDKVDWLTKHPLTEEYVPVAAIEFRDGTRVELSSTSAPKVINKP